MGEQWLTDVTAALEQAGWRVEPGYPGKSATALEQPMAAVNLSRGSTRDASAGITVTVLVPRNQGLAQCQSLAAQATVLLSGAGGDWSFDGWNYDSRSDCFRVEVEGNAAFSVQDEEEVLDEGYEVFIGEATQLHVTEFTARKDAQRRLVRPHGQSDPSGVVPGMGGWQVELVQLIPSGTAEPEETGDSFSLKVSRGGISVTYTKCCWAEYESRQLSNGTKVTRRGFALNREVV